MHFSNKLAPQSQRAHSARENSYLEVEYYSSVVNPIVEVACFIWKAKRKVPRLTGRRRNGKEWNDGQQSLPGGVDA